MKNLILILSVMLIVFSCNKEEEELPTPVPVPAVVVTPPPVVITPPDTLNPPPPPPPVFIYGCDSSDWKYEVLVDYDTSSTAFIVDISHNDGFGNTLTTTSYNAANWTSPVFTFNGTVYPLVLSVSSNPNYNVKAIITLNIYREGILVETSGPVEYCYSVVPCPANTINIMSLQHLCQ